MWSAGVELDRLTSVDTEPLQLNTRSADNAQTVISSYSVDNFSKCFKTRTQQKFVSIALLISSSL